MLALPIALLAFHAPLVRPPTSSLLRMEAPPPPATDDAAEEAPTPAAPAPPKKFDLKEATEAQRQDGAGFNQFDPVLLVSRFVSRRFGLAGGFAFVALLAATEGNEILKSVLDTGPQPGSGETITTASGLKYVDVLVSSSGDAPRPGAIIGLTVACRPRGGQLQVGVVAFLSLTEA